MRANLPPGKRGSARIRDLSDICEMEEKEENDATLSTQMDYFSDAKLDDIDSKKIFEGQPVNYLYSRSASRK